MTSRRLERTSRVLKEAISRVIIQEVSDPRMGFVTVTRVEPSPDLKSARVHVSVLGDDAVCRRTFKGLEHAAGFIQRSVVRLIVLRNIPALTFVRDDSIKRSVRISRILADARAEEPSKEEDEPQ